jgi:hypothetical protein
MRTNEEIGQRRSLRATAPPIRQIRLARQEGSLEGNGLALEHCSWQRLVEILDAAIADGNLRVDDRIYDEPGAVGACYGVGRPRELADVLGHNVEQDAAVDQKGHCSIAAGESHDRIGAHRHIPTAAQVGDQARTSSLSAAWRQANDPYHAALHFERDLSMRQQPGAFADVCWNCDLAFGGYAHI